LRGWFAMSWSPRDSLRKSPHSSGTPFRGTRLHFHARMPCLVIVLVPSPSLFFPPLNAQSKMPVFC
jgi:hypothetical protein